MSDKKRTILPVLLLFLCFAGHLSAAETIPDFWIDLPAQVSSYSQNHVRVAVPGEGFLTVRARQLGDETVIWSGPADGREITFDWDGLLAYGEMLRIGPEAQLTAELTDEAGNRLEASAPFSVRQPECRVQFALPYRDVLRAPDPLFQIDVKLSAAGKLHYAVCPENDPEKQIVSGTRTVKNPDLVEVIRWRGTLAGGKNAPAGKYRFTCWPDGQKDRSVSFLIEVSEEKAAVLPLETSVFWADRVPVTKEERIAFFSSPVPAVDALEGSGIPVYESPSYNSGKRGSVHGSTVSVKVLELKIPNGWTKIAFYRYGDGTYQEGYIRTEKLAMVYPSGHYGLIADLASQTMHVFLDGEMIGSLRFSSSLEGLKVETCCGVFLTGLRMGGFREEGFQYDYAIRIDGSNLLHQVGYRYGQNASFEEQRKTLGTPASHGCIRLAEHPGEDGEGLTAWWIYSHIPKRTLLIVVDDYAKRIGEALAERGYIPAAPVQDPVN